MTRKGKISDNLFTLLCAILIVSSVFVSNVNAKSRKSYGHHHKSGGSHYPKHSGLSGSSGSHHSIKPTYTYPTQSHHTNHLSGGSSVYPNSNSLSGSGTHHGSPSYPASSGLSGNSRGGGSPINSYQTSSSSSSFGGKQGSTSYPSSNGLSGNTASGIHNSPGGWSVNNNRGATTYPASNGLSGNTASGNSYTSGGSSYPGNSHQSWRSNQNVYHHTNSRTVIHHHHHYDYSPPTVIHYRSSYGLSSYPVYTGIPPTYVYEYRSSGNRYSTLLAGLALYNLGRMSSNSNYDNYHRHYQPQPHERCLFGVRYNTGAVEEMVIECKAITYFIYESTQVPPPVQPQTQTHVLNQTTITTQTMFPNGTLINPANTLINVNGVNLPNTQYLGGNGQMINTQINTITTTTTQVNDPKLYGNPVAVDSNMVCYVKRTTFASNMEKPVPCDLLQEYATSSLRRNSGVMVKSSLSILLIAVSFLLY